MLSKVHLRNGVMAAAALIAVMPAVAACGDSERCAELREWYDSAPYDSNPTIARDFQRACNETPPPVINGELDENFNYT